MTQCPCGSAREYDACCGPFIEGRDFPPTAETLMRARYSAHTKGIYDYLQASTHPAARDEVDWSELEKWSSSVNWEGLDIVSTDEGGENDVKGVVSFVARFNYEGMEQEHREHSFFQRDEAGHWVYVDGEMDKPEPFRRETPKTGRNEPCPCGSGKKYKKCCGAN